MKWYISLLSLASLSVALAVPIEGPSAIARNVATEEREVAVVKKAVDEDVELFTWGWGPWSYGGSKKKRAEAKA